MTPDEQQNADLELLEVARVGVSACNNALRLLILEANPDARRQAMERIANELRDAANLLDQARPLTDPAILRRAAEIVERQARGDGWHGVPDDLRRLADQIEGASGDG